MNVRAHLDLFSITPEEVGSKTCWLVSVSMMEICQEAAQDLLRCVWISEAVHDLLRCVWNACG